MDEWFGMNALDDSLEYLMDGGKDMLLYRLLKFSKLLNNLGPIAYSFD